MARCTNRRDKNDPIVSILHYELAQFRTRCMPATIRFSRFRKTNGYTTCLRGIGCELLILKMARCILRSLLEMPGNRTRVFTEATMCKTDRKWVSYPMCLERANRST